MVNYSIAIVGRQDFKGKAAQIPIVLLTARVQREDEIRGWLSGAADYLPKPFNPSTLTEVVRRTLMNEYRCWLHGPSSASAALWAGVL